MPYIKPEDRKKYTDDILKAVELITGGSEPPLIQGELFGYWANRIVKKYVQDPHADSHSFNSNMFNEDKRAKLASNADHIMLLIGAGQPIDTAGELNYCLSSVYWGILGDALNIDSASYGMRTYLKGMLHKISDSIASQNTGSQRDATMSFRRHIVAKGVVTDVIDECNFQKTRVYEDMKIKENGSLWEAGHVWLATDKL